MNVRSAIPRRTYFNAQRDFLRKSSVEVAASLDSVHVELWNMLVGGANSSPTRQTGYDTALQRSIRFKRAHEQLQQIWRKNNTSSLLASAVSVLTCLESIRKLLEDEVQTPAPQLCARHVSTFQMYTTVVQVTSNYYDELIIHETLDIFKILIHSEEVEFLEEAGFADALIGFVGKLSTAEPSTDTETKIAEVLFGIASMIRLQPQVMPVWFRPGTQNSETTSKQNGPGPVANADKDLFPLFYLTLDYVHHDGKVGDFARTGLLYIIESATSSEALEKWIVESDLATLMASGLGALYSQLSRKLVLSFPEDSVPAIVTFSEAASPPIPHDAVKTTSPDFQSHLATFLSYLVFWQDILEHCRSEDIKRSLLDHFKFLFLQQLLYNNPNTLPVDPITLIITRYPSLMESSDVDGGSSVAVLTYLRCIVESINHAELLHVTLQYLLALPDKSEDESKPARPTTLARRRKSSMLITTLAQGSEKPMPDLFTLVDLILTNLKSGNHQTVTATLRLVSVILQSKHQYAVSSIVKTKPPSDDTPARTIVAHNRDTKALFSMVENLIEHDDLREVYEAHLQDARTLVESHCCSTILLTLPALRDGDRAVGVAKSEQTKSVRSHMIRPDDPLTNSMVALLGDFLTNEIDTNLSLTQAFATLASCGNTSLDYWLLGGPARNRTYIKQSIASVSDCGDSDRDDTITIDEKSGSEIQTTNVAKSDDSKLNSHGPTGYNAPSPVFTALDSLVQQVERFRHDIQEFDTYLAERRHLFKVGEDIDKAVTNDMLFLSRKSHKRSSGDSTRVSITRNRGADHIASISERLMSETSSSNVSRSSSPRGRQYIEPLPTTALGRSNYLQISQSPSPAHPASRAFSPSPLREDSYISTPAKRVLSPIGPADSLRQKLKIRTNFGHDSRDVGSSETSSIRSESTSAELRSTETAAKEITLGHLLTNVIILQEFILELASIVEIRASLFGEVKPI